MSYRSSGGRRRKSGAALLVSRLLQIVVILLVLAAAVLLIQGARKAFGMATSTLQPQGGQSDVSAVQPSSGSSTVPSASQSVVPTLPEPPEEPSVPAVGEPLGVVVVDPGHGGRDPGCGEVGSLEKDLVLSISLMVQEMLQEQNVTVVMTRDTDVGVSLDDRTKLANQSEADLFVSIHCNAFDGKASGMEVYYYKDETAKQMAEDITMAAKELGIKTREVRTQKFQVISATRMPAVLVETGFLTDEAECALLMTPEHQEKLATAIVSALMTALDAESAPLA